MAQSADWRLEGDIKTSDEAVVESYARLIWEYTIPRQDNLQEDVQKEIELFRHLVKESIKAGGVLTSRKYSPFADNNCEDFRQFLLGCAHDLQAINSTGASNALCQFRTQTNHTF